MNIRQTGLVAIGFAAGIVVATFVMRSTGIEVDAPLHERPVMDESDRSARTMGLTRDAYEKRIAELSTEVEILRGNAAAGPSRKSPVLGTIQELAASSLATAERRQTESLLAAGFSMDRIEWLRRRSDELLVDQARKAEEARREGRPVANALAYVLDQDLDLREEIGDEEYERYRRALGRPIGISVTEVLPGSTAEHAGLKPGDDIVGYGGKRIYNIGELNYLVSKGTPGASVLVDVRRNGQTLQFAVPSGSMSIKSPMFTPPTLSFPPAPSGG